MRALLIAGFCAFATIAQANGPAVYSPSGLEIGVIVRQSPDGSFVVMPLPSAGLGNAPLSINPALMRLRPDGNWTAYLLTAPLSTP